MPTFPLSPSLWDVAGPPHSVSLKLSWRDHKVACPLPPFARPVLWICQLCVHPFLTRVHPFLTRVASLTAPPAPPAILLCRHGCSSRGLVFVCLRGDVEVSAPALSCPHVHGAATSVFLGGIVTESVGTVALASLFPPALVGSVYVYMCGACVHVWFVCVCTYACVVCVLHACVHVCLSMCGVCMFVHVCVSAVCL